ncbi:MAG: ankyrin repeat domain-containing protein [Bryobacteraceae bacterium]|nr:ankyrin repeat domain-containing protein [Bryobacteraceae bacterium]
MSTFTFDLFRRAVTDRDAIRLRGLLDSNPELKLRIDEPLFAFDTPAIVHAAGGGSREVIEVLIAAGADVNARSRWWAGSFGVLDSADPALSDYLIQRGAVLDVHASARLGMLEKLQELISAQPELVHARGGDGRTPLHFASTVEIADYLLTQGADIDAVDIDHESTAAQYLVESHPEIVRYLIQRGCRTDILLAVAIGDASLVRKHLDSAPECIRTRVNEQYFPKSDSRSGGTIYTWTLGMNKSVLEIARKFDRTALLKDLIERSPAGLQLVDALRTNDNHAAKTLLATYPDLMQTLSDQDRREIVYAAKDNEAETVRLMLEYGWPSDGGQPETPLHWAAFHGNARMASEILRHKPLLERRDPEFGATPLGWAIHGSLHGWHCKTGSYAEVVESLMKAGAAAPEQIGGSDAVKEVLRRYCR